MNKLFTKVVGVALGLTMAVGVGVAVGASRKETVPVHAATTYEQLTSIASIDESAQYVLGVEGYGSGKGFHKSGTSSWGVCTTSDSDTPLYYSLVKGANNATFTASTTINSTTYYLLVPTSNTFSMSTTSGATNSTLIIGTTQVSGTNYAVANSGTTTRHLRINGTSGLRSYAGTTGSMAFFYKVVSSVSSECTVTYDANGGTGTMTDSNSPYTAGSNTVTVLANSFTAPTGFQFNGWNTKADGSGTPYAAGNTLSNISDNITFYAQWAEIADSYQHDVLTASDFNATTTTYVSTTNISGTSSAAVYCGNTAKGNGVIQARADSGIGTSSTGGHLRKIKVVWESHTASGRSLAVMGNTSAYTATGAGSGTQIGTLTCNTSFLTSIVLFDSNTYYPYISVNPSAAVYIQSIDFGFEPVYPTSIPVTGESSVYVGNTITLTATPTHSSGWTMTNANYTWSSSNSSVASVNQSGVVTGVSAGSATIYATSNGDNTVVGSKLITVSDVPTNYIELSVTTDTGTTSGYVGDAVYVTVDDSNLVGNINWTVSGGTISEQDGDNSGFTGYLASAGTITITATDSGDNTNTAHVTLTSIKSLNDVTAPTVSTKTWTATAATDFGATISEVNDTDSGTLDFDDSSTMSYERTLEFLASGKSDYLGYTSPYIQFGSSNALEKLVLTTGASVSNITKVVVDCGSKNGASNVTVTVGGNAFDSSKVAPNAKGEVTFNGSASGVVEITMEVSSKTAGCAQYIASVEITYSSGAGTIISNKAGYHTAQAAVIEYAESFNSTLSAICVAYGSTNEENLSSAWDTLSGTFTNWFVNTGKSLTSAEKERALQLFAYASSNEGGDDLQQLLAKYDWIVAHYSGCSDFLNSVADRTEVSQASARILPTITGNSGTTVSIIVIISMVSLTAIGGYFFLKKRKETH